MREIWLHNNRRITGLCLFGSVTLLVLSLSVLYFAFGRSSATLRSSVAIMCAIVVAMTVRHAKLFSTPRLVFTGTHLEVTLAARPVEVPIDVVEVFFLGQGPSQVHTKTGRDIVNSTLVVRLAESASDWRCRSVNPRLGQWCDGYITIRGIWCEPLNVDVIRRLNHRLVEAKRHKKGKTTVV
jgi:hypothetical protein